MNDRIKQLMAEADRKCSETRGIYDEILARLIVAECLSQVDKVDAMLEDDKEKTGVAWVGLAIAKHFGVE